MLWVSDGDLIHPRASSWGSVDLHLVHPRASSWGSVDGGILAPRELARGSLRSPAKSGTWLVWRSRRRLATVTARGRDRNAAGRRFAGPVSVSSTCPRDVSPAARPRNWVRLWVSDGDLIHPRASSWGSVVGGVLAPRELARGSLRSPAIGGTSARLAVAPSTCHSSRTWPRPKCGGSSFRGAPFRSRPRALVLCRRLRDRGMVCAPG